MKKSSGFLFFPILKTMIFIALKLTGHINWSWVWVLSPVWIPAVALLVFIFVLETAYLCIKKEW